MRIAREAAQDRLRAQLHQMRAAHLYQRLQPGREPHRLARMRPPVGAVVLGHDRDQTGLWVILAFVPVIGWFWWLINLGLLDGTPGANQYGPSPKGFGGTAPAAA